MSDHPITEHPVQQPIRAIEIDNIPESQAAYVVGQNGVTRIEACIKPGDCEKCGPYKPMRVLNGVRQCGACGWVQEPER